jgi:protein TonB
MNNPTIFDELDQAIDQMMAEPDAARAGARAEIGELLDLASDLRHLPRPDFKMRLKAELEWQNWSPVAGPRLETPSQRGALVRKSRPAEANIMPTLSGNGYGIYPIRRANFAASVLLHAAAMVIFAALGAMVMQNRPKDHSQAGSVVLLSRYQPMASAAQKKPGGGGGGGERSKLQLSAGGPPKASMHAQLAPPVVIRPKEESKIMAEPTVVADLKLPDSLKVGDRLSKAMAPSNGPGVGSGVGSGSGGGYGAGHGRGVGRGDNYGYGGAAEGNGRITTPKLIYSPDPEFSEEARKSKHQGVVVMTVLVGTDGRIHDAQVTQSLGMGLDEKALETVKLWKFEPARASDGSPVAVYASIEVNFRLY